jgi:hypothetical protein
MPVQAEWTIYRGVPPFRETRAYVARVIRLLRHYEKELGWVLVPGGHRALAGEVPLYLYAEYGLHASMATLMLIQRCRFKK